METYGYGGEDTAVSFLPRAIPSEYQGLSLDELKGKSITPSYEELKDNIDNYKGKLVWFNGKIEREYEGSTAGTYQSRVFVSPPPETSAVSIGWTDRMLILHSLERGPKLPDEAEVKFAGTVVGLYEGGITIKKRSEYKRVSISVPMISIVKAALSTDMD